MFSVMKAEWLSGCSEKVDICSRDDCADIFGADRTLEALSFAVGGSGYDRSGDQNSVTVNHSHIGSGEHRIAFEVVVDCINSFFVGRRHANDSLMLCPRTEYASSAGCRDASILDFVDVMQIDLEDGMNHVG